MKNQFIYIIILSITFFCSSYSQEKEVETALRFVEQGRTDTAKIILKKLVSKYPSSPSVFYLDGVLTKDGNSSLNKFLTISNKYPKSKYADASLFKVFSYYYALGNYSKANQYLQKLKLSYPGSSYIKAADPEYTEKQDAPDLTCIYKIQAGAFINKDNANSLQADLEDAGYSTEIKKKSLGGATLLIVYAGCFVNEKEASGVLAKLNKDFRLNGRIVNMKK